jgi:hypothetical protein
MTEQQKISSEDVMEVDAADLVKATPYEEVGDRWDIDRSTGTVQAVCPRCQKPRGAECCDDCRVQSTLHTKTAGNKPRIVSAVGAMASHGAMGSEAGLGKEIQEAMVAAVQRLLDEGVPIDAEAAKYREAQMAARKAVLDKHRG